MSTSRKPYGRGPGKDGSRAAPATERIVGRSVARIAISGLLLAIGVLLARIPLSAQEGQAAPIRADTGTHLVVYQQDLALVTEQLTIELSEGPADVVFSNVAAELDPTSVLLSADPPGRLRILEQTFDPGRVGSDRLLERFSGREIRIVTRESSTFEGVLLSAGDDIVLRREDGSLVALPRATIRTFLFPELPEGLSTRPTLSWRVRAAEEGSIPASLSYLTGGIGWRADYELLLDADESRFDLQGSITIDNRSGSDFPGAHLTLLAGEIHRVADERTRDVLTAEMARAPEDSPVESRPFSEYHRYDIPWTVDLRDRRTSRIGFVTAAAVPVSKRHVYDAVPVPRLPREEPLTDPRLGQTDTSRRVRTTLRFHTGEEEGVGARLPAGRVRIYRQGEDGVRLLLGEDRIGHTPRDETVRVRMGASFDIVGERVRVEHERLGDYGLEETYRVTLRNHREEDVEVHVVEHLFRWSNWRITNEELDGAPIDHRVRDADTVEWPVPVPAAGESVLTYSVRYTWR